MSAWLARFSAAKPIIVIATITSTRKIVRFEIVIRTTSPRSLEENILGITSIIARSGDHATPLYTQPEYEHQQPARRTALRTFAAKRAPAYVRRHPQCIF